MKKNSMFNPRTQKSRIAQTAVFLCIIAACLLGILILWPAGARAGIQPVPITSAGGGPTSPAPADNTSAQGKTTPSPAPVSAKLAIIVDDAGYNLTKLERLLTFPGKLTIAVLPQVLYSRRSAELIHNAGKEVLLHLPMQPEGNEDPGPGVITVNQNPGEITSVLEKDIATVPYAAGINNHMGSLATTDAQVVGLLLAYCKQHGLFFLDSKTTAASVVTRLAPEYDLPVLSRDLFLDNDRGKAHIKATIIHGMELARKHGYAVLIGHVHDDLIETLLEMYPLFVKQGFDLVTASELLQFLEKR